MFAQDQITSCGPACGLAEHARRLCAVLLAAIGLYVPQLSWAGESGEFRIEDAHAWSADGAYLLDAQFSIELSSGAREALDNGVPLVFELQVQIVKKHTWWWDVVTVELKQSRQLQYHALSQSYLVKDLDAGTQGNYRRLEDALHAAGAIRNLFLTDLQMAAGKGFNIRLRGSLDIESLPTPVRLPAYVSSAWDMKSEWYAWPLVR
jgi:hypothetical protein